MDEIIKTAEKYLLPDVECDWNEEKVPLAERGVSIYWLYDFVKSIDLKVGACWEDYFAAENQLEKGKLYFNVPEDIQLSMQRPMYSQANFTTTTFVQQIILDVTRASRCPLYARIPQKYRGSPSVFISHTWSSYLFRGGIHGSLDILRNNSFYNKKDISGNAWIDFACYNQHLIKDENIATDMAGIISQMGSLAIPLTSTPFFSRSWCVWEFICAYRSGVPVTICHNTPRSRKYFSSESSEFPSRFSSITDLAATMKEDQEQIFNLLISTFGSVADADKYIAKVLDEHRVI